MIFEKKMKILLNKSIFQKIKNIFSKKEKTNFPKIESSEFWEAVKRNENKTERPTCISLHTEFMKKIENDIIKEKKLKFYKK